MHHHCEIIMPPVEDIETAVEQIMEPFDENAEEAVNAFWDFWIIGGRWSGCKLEQLLGEDRIQSFSNMLRERGVTVSSFVAGKPDLEPADQIPEVDRLWREWFPESGLTVCPLFRHSNDQYSNDSLLPGDVTPYAKVPRSLTCSRLIFAGPYLLDESVLKATFMLSQDFWNGVNHIESIWDGTLGHAADLFTDKIEMYRAEYAEKITPRDDWLVVTVDYHS